MVYRRPAGCLKCFPVFLATCISVLFLLFNYLALKFCCKYTLLLNREQVNGELIFAYLHNHKYLCDYFRPGIFDV